MDSHSIRQAILNDSAVQDPNKVTEEFVLFMPDGSNFLADVMTGFSSLSNENINVYNEIDGVKAVNNTQQTQIDTNASDIATLDSRVDLITTSLIKVVPTVHDMFIDATTSGNINVALTGAGATIDVRDGVNAVVIFDNPGDGYYAEFPITVRKMGSTGSITWPAPQGSDPGFLPSSSGNTTMFNAYIKGTAVGAPISLVHRFGGFQWT